MHTLTLVAACHSAAHAETVMDALSPLMDQMKGVTRGAIELEERQTLSPAKLNNLRAFVRDLEAAVAGTDVPAYASDAAHRILRDYMPKFALDLADDAMSVFHEGEDVHTDDKVDG